MALSALLLNVTSFFLIYCASLILEGAEVYFGTFHLIAETYWCIMYFPSAINTDKEYISGQIRSPAMVLSVLSLDLVKPF